MENLQSLIPYVVSLLVGVLIGIERERSHPGSQGILGLRSFTIASLLGALAGSPRFSPLAPLIIAFSFILIAISYWGTARRLGKDDLGLTTELAAGVVVVLGYVSHGSPLTTIVLGVLVALLLVSKRTLHRWSHRVQTGEIQAVALIVLFGIAVVSTLKDQPVDPWGLVNLRRFGELILILATLEFSGYLISKIFGHGRSAWIVGFLGGFASSTAVTLAAARKSRNAREDWRIYAGTVISAQIAALLALVGVVAAASAELGTALIIRTVGIVAAALIALFICRRADPAPGTEVQVRSPIDVKNIARLSLLLMAIFTLMSLFQRFLGETASGAFSFVTGWFELHAVSMAIASLHAQGSQSLQASLMNCGLALIGSFTAKVTLAWISGSRPFATFLTLAFAPFAALSFVLFCLY